MTNLGAFIALAALLALIPGPDTTVVTRNTLVGSRAAGLATVVGVATGLMVWSFAAALGVAAVIKASAPAFDPTFGVLIALALIFSLIGLTILTTYCLLAARVSTFLRRPRPRRVL